MKKRKSSTRAAGLSTRWNSALSVIIPCEPGADPRDCVQALRALPAAERARIGELLLARGRNPSRQRNVAAARARGAWLLFLDSDSRAQAGLVTGLLEAARTLGAVAAGGPNLPLEDEPPLGLEFDRVLASWAGSMASRARYRGVGPRRLSGEKELILCNLLMSRQTFVVAGGFREDLYPNEENELFNRLQGAGARLAYDPSAQVRRPRRRGVGAWVEQGFRYGRGRTQQMRRNFFPGDLLNLLPLALPAAWLAVAVAAPARPWVLALPAAYVLACLVAMGGRPKTALFLALRHHSYAGGLLAGLFQAPPRRPVDVHLSRVPWRR